MDFSFIFDLLTRNILGEALWLWLSFLGIVIGLLALDLGIFNKKDHEIGIKESLRMSVFYISIGLLFGLWVWNRNGAADAMDYYTVYVLEKSLSLDNLFVISVIFASFHIPRLYQHRVLFWGIIGVIALRAMMISAGAALVHQYDWVLLIFAAILIYTGVKMMLIKEDGEEDYTQKPYVIFLARHLRVSKHIHGNKFFTRTQHHDRKSNNRIWHATPLFLALCTIEMTDILFAFDSVPAALSITTDIYIVYTANIFAILGLRALFFAMENVIHRFHYLKYALSVVLIFIGSKVYWSHFGEKIDPAVSLSITLGVLACGVLVSLVKTKQKS